jgi:pimeloyl-ACP methyl ester carboxylesterase
VLLITGSGPQDRDETLLGHRPFAVLADHLTLNGIAVLRVDDRGVGESTGDFTAATSEDFADDAEAGFRWLRARPEVDRAKVGLLGHSEGAIVAPMVAAREPAVAFLILLAAPGVPGEQILYRQGELILRAAGAGDEVVEASRTLQEALFRAVRNAADGAAAQAAARAVLVRRAKTLEGPERDQAEAMFDLQAAEVASPWFRFFLRHDPAPVLAKVRCPVLAVWGEKDLQVPPDQNRPPLEAALAAGGNQNVAARVLPGLNHLLQPATTGHPGEYGQIELTIDTVALQLIVFWLQDAVGAVPQAPPQ